MKTPLHFKHADEPVLSFIPLLDQEFDDGEDGMVDSLHMTFH